MHHYGADGCRGGGDRVSKDHTDYTRAEIAKPRGRIATHPTFASSPGFAPSSVLLPILLPNDVRVCAWSGLSARPETESLCTSDCLSFTMCDCRRPNLITPRTRGRNRHRSMLSWTAQAVHPPGVRPCHGLNCRGDGG